MSLYAVVIIVVGCCWLLVVVVGLLSVVIAVGCYCNCFVVKNLPLACCCQCNYGHYKDNGNKSASG